MTEMTDKIYPTLSTIREDPSAPPVVNGGADDRGHGYRLNLIREIQTFLETEIKNRDAFSKKYFRIAKVVNWVDNGLITVTVGTAVTGAALLASGVGAPLGVALEISGAVTGVITLFGNIFSAKARTKAIKHRDISKIAATKLNTIASHVSKALMDDFISNEEFNLILEEMNKYKTMKEEVRSNTKKKLNKEEEESLIEKGRQQTRASFRKLVETNNKFEILKV